MLADPDRIQRLPRRTFQFLLGLFIAGVALVVVSSSLQTARANNHDAECEELWTRYFRVKVQGLHFCGPAYYGVPLVEGFQTLALVFPATLWIARWLAASQQRGRLTPDDIAQALAISDHHHGYSPIFGSFGFRRRVHTLAQLGEIPKLVRWYST